MDIEKRGGMTIEEINKFMGGSFREVPFQEVQRYFPGIAFQNKIEGMFMDNVAKMKARKWYTWTKAGRMFVAGLSQYKDGHWGLTMYGHYTEQNKAFFNVWPMIVDERDLASKDPAVVPGASAAAIGRTIADFTRRTGALI